MTEKVLKTREGIEVDVIDMFRVKVFTPPLPLFIEPEGCPPDIKEQLNVISSLLTLNSAAAAMPSDAFLKYLWTSWMCPKHRNFTIVLRKD